MVAFFSVVAEVQHYPYPELDLLALFVVVEKLDLLALFVALKELDLLALFVALKELDLLALFVALELDRWLCLLHWRILIQLFCNT